MKLPEELEPLRNRKIWICHPLIWNPKKHGGVGGYDKPPINPNTLRPGYTDRPESLATFDVAAAQIGKKAWALTKEGLIECEVSGVGIAFGGTGICGIDLDNVIDQDKGLGATIEAKEIFFLMKSYTELSPSGTGIHIFFFGTLPDGIPSKLAASKSDPWGTVKAEYQLFDSGYMTVTGRTSKTNYPLSDRTKEISEVYKLYFEEVAPIEKLSSEKPRRSSSVVSCIGGFTYARWLEEVRRLSDADILDRIFKSNKVGDQVKQLYDGDMRNYNEDHSRADLALCSFFYGFTSDRDLTERLFRSSALYRKPGTEGKSRSYLVRTLNRAEKQSVKLIGHIEFTPEEKRAYAKKKNEEEFKAYSKAWNDCKKYRLGRSEKKNYDRRKI